MKLLVLFVVVMVAMIAVDWCWAKYMIYAAEKEAAKAAHWSSLIVGMSALTVFSYNRQPILILAAVLGAWVGTYLAIKHHKD